MNFIKDEFKDPADIPADTIKAGEDNFITSRKFPVFVFTKNPFSVSPKDLKAGDKPYSSFDFGGEIVALNFNSTGQYIMFATSGGEVRIHESLTAKKRWSSVINHLLQSGNFSPNGSRVAVGGNEGIVWLYGIP
jgi:hypothetical protein